MLYRQLNNILFRNLSKILGKPQKFYSSLKNDSLSALSPLDGRYQSQVSELREYFSEAALIKYRIKVEVQWLKFLLEEQMVQVNNQKYQATSQDIKHIDTILENFNEDAALRVKEIEKATNHDVKAVEYYVKEQLEKHESLNNFKEYVHFCCTSEDINNLAYSLIFQDANKFITGKLDILKEVMINNCEEFSEIPMLSRTHGQVASPTTVGKEFANFTYRMNSQLKKMKNHKFSAKLNGAVGNYNAHYITYPEYEWKQLTQQFIEKQNLKFNPYTTQIEPHDTVAEYYAHFSLLNTILLDFSRDMWNYISIRYFKLKTKKTEVGSSTMPHKVNPIDYENAEGNLGMANSIMNHLRDKLPISRYQRDLSDSTVMRNNGLAFGYSHLAYNSLIKGLQKIDCNHQIIEEDLNNHWEVLGEPIQTVMRKFGLANPYELLKELTRGKSKIEPIELYKLIEDSDLPNLEKQRLLLLSPSTYKGNAIEMAKNIRKECE